MIAGGARGLGGFAIIFRSRAVGPRYGWIWIRFGILPGVGFRDVLPGFLLGICRRPEMIAGGARCLGGFAIIFLPGPGFGMLAGFLWEVSEGLPGARIDCERGEGPRGSCNHFFSGARQSWRV